MRQLNDAHGRMHRWIWADLEANGVLNTHPLVMGTRNWQQVSSGWHADRSRCYAPCCGRRNRSLDVALRIRDSR